MSIKYHLHSKSQHSMWTAYIFKINADGKLSIKNYVPKWMLENVKLVL